MTRALLLLGLTALLSANASAVEVTDLDYEPIKRLVVLHEGRFKPLDTYARETVRHVFEDTDLDGAEPIATFLSILVNPGPYLDLGFLPVTHPDLVKEIFGGKDVVTPKDVMARTRVLQEIYNESLNAKAFIEMRKGRVDPELREKADNLVEMGKAVIPLLGRTRGLFDMETDLRIVPSGDLSAGWGVLPVDKPEDPPAEPGHMDKPWREMLDALRAKDDVAFARASVELVAVQRTIRPRAMPSPGVLELEVLYNRVMPRTVAFFAFLLATVLYGVHIGVRSTLTRILATVAFGLAILVDTYILTMFTIFAERLPLRNLPEVFLVVVWFVPVIALVLQWLLRTAIYGGIGSVLGLIGFGVAAFAMDPRGFEIRPMVAILNSGWREIHILSIILSYAVLFVAAGIHVAYIGSRFVDGWGRPGGDRSRTLDRQAYHVVAWGFLLLGLGIATGAAWGNDAWGRYWGWDSKEVWATVAWVIYGVLLHVRSFYRWRGVPLAALNLLGFGAVLFCYFGVTYLLTGLHSYGAS